MGMDNVIPGEVAAYSRNILVRAAASAVHEAPLYGHSSGPLAYEQAALDMPLNVFAAHKLRLAATMLENTDRYRDALHDVAKLVGQLDVLAPAMADEDKPEELPAVVRAKDGPKPSPRSLTEQERTTIGKVMQRDLNNTGTASNAPDASNAA